ncbi:MAG: helix-turn-helix domain-containing protein [Alphaproteobacteria bacterium]|nr:helix-turn-helix domain-containing protein [Alphaproteobacteria bacterium]
MNQATQLIRLPESMELDDIGPYFRSLREHYRLSEQDVSARLHIRVKYIQAIETSDMSQLPGKVYARGYVSTYAEFLGIDPDNAVERFLGTETKEKVEEYFIPEPARLGVRLNHKLRFAVLVCIVVALLYALLGMSGGSDEESSVVPVPESLVESSRSMVMPVGRALRCAQGSRLVACMQSAVQAADGHPMQHPDIFTKPVKWGESRVQEVKKVEEKKSEAPKKKIKKDAIKKISDEDSILPWLR